MVYPPLHMGWKVGYIWILTTDRKWGQHIQVVRFSEVPVFGYYSLHVSSNKLFISGCPVGVRIDLRSSQWRNPRRRWRTPSVHVGGFPGILFFQAQLQPKKEDFDWTVSILQGILSAIGNDVCVIIKEKKHGKLYQMFTSRLSRASISIQTIHQ